jgi:hypothetical protein
LRLVLDASLTLAWYFEDEATAETDRLLYAVTHGGAVVPPLWRLEVANGFQSGNSPQADRPALSRRLPRRSAIAAD